MTWLRTKVSGLEGQVSELASERQRLQQQVAALEEELRGVRQQAAAAAGSSGSAASADQLQKLQGQIKVRIQGQIQVRISCRSSRGRSRCGACPLSLQCGLQCGNNDRSDSMMPHSRASPTCARFVQPVCRRSR